MRIAKIVLTAAPGLAFVAGLGVGYVLFEGASDERIVHVARGSSPVSGSRVGLDEATGAEAEGSSGGRSGRADRRGGTGGRSKEGGEAHREQPAHSTFAEVRASLQAALAAGDSHAARRALHEMSVDPDASLTEEELGAWMETLSETPLDLMHEVARFLARTGGAAGAELVAAWVAEADDVPMDFLHRAIHGLADVPPELRGEVAPVLEGLLVDGELSHDLLRSAAHAYARLHVDDDAGKGGGFDALMGLLRERPEISPVAVLEATREFGTADNIGTLLGLLAEGSDWSRRETQTILNAVGSLAARSGEGEALLELLENPPESVSRSEIAAMFRDTKHDLGAELLKEAIAATRGDPRAQEMIARGLARSGRPGLEALFEASQDPEIGLDPTRLARALTESGREAVPMMIDLLGSHESPGVIEPLARAVFENGGGEAVSGLLDQIGGDAAVERRRGIAQALGDSFARVDPGRLMDLLERSNDQEISEGLSRALVRSGDPAGVLPRLREMRAAGQDPRLVHHINRAIERLSALARAREGR